MKNLLLLICTLFTTTLVVGQSTIIIPSNPTKNYKKNYFYTHIDYAFLGTGDHTGRSLGLTYSRLLYKNIGCSIAYRETKASGNGYEISKDQFIDVINKGEAVLDKSSYSSYNLGFTYRVNDKERSTLLTSVGLNYKIYDYQYVNQSMGSGSNFEIISIATEHDAAASFYVSLDYLYYITGDVSLGFHASIEGDNTILSVGASMGYRF